MSLLRRNSWRYLLRHPENLDARMQRSKALLWSGAYSEAERALEELLRLVPAGETHERVELDLARLYRQTARPLRAVSVVDDVLARSPDNEDAKNEASYGLALTKPTLSSRDAMYVDSRKNFILSATESLTVPITHAVSAIGDVGVYRLGSDHEALEAARSNVGARVLLSSKLNAQLEVLGGPRFYRFFPPSGGINAAFRIAPTGYFRGEATYGYDDAYYELAQSATVASGIHVHTFALTPELRLGSRVSLAARGVARLAVPENPELEGGATLMVALGKSFSVGYTGQWLAWKYNDLSYWTPQGYIAHQAVLRSSGDSEKLGLLYDVLLLAGIAGERVDGLPDPKVGPAWGAGALIGYAPNKRVQLRLKGQYGQSLRTTAQDVATGTEGPIVRVYTRGTYYWVGTSLTATLVF